MSDTHDLGFTFRKTRDGFDVFHHGRKAASLRGPKADQFETALARTDTAGQQRLMAKVTGNYKRGNERTAGNHPRNRR